MNQPQSTPGTSKEMLRSIRILFGIIIAGAFMFVIIISVLSSFPKTNAGSPVKSEDNIFLIVCTGIAAICLVFAWTGYKKGIALAKDSLISITDKLNQYRSALIRYLALCEAPALFGIILFFMNGNYRALIVTALMLVAMLVKAPVRKRVVDDLGLDWKQQQELE